MSGELATRAFCWRVERKDGFGLALTSHDAALTVDGVRYEPAPGLTPASIKRSMGLDPANCEVSGVLSSDAISEADLVTGRWDEAALRLSVAEWDEPESLAQMLLSGTLGLVEAKGDGFSADLLGAAKALDAPVCPQTSPECRAELGDGNCRVDMAARTIRASVVAHDGTSVRVDRVVSDDVLFGSARVLAGAMNGLRFMVTAVEGDLLTLRTAPQGLIAAGTPLLLTQGCDKRLETCAARFGNAANFRGEPHLPGNDLLTRYPGD